jgi:glycosyltransferase involved in cell wall biosynthesis
MALPKKIIFLASARSISGVKPGRKIKGILACWEQMGYEVRSIFGGDLFSNSGSDDGKRTYGNASYYKKWYRRIGLLNPLLHSLSEWRDILHHQGMVDLVREISVKFKADLIWERSCRLHCPGLVVAKRLGIPYVLEWKDNLIMYRYSLLRSKAFNMENRKNQEADSIVVESQVLLERLSRDGIDKNKILVAHNAVNATQFNRDKETRECMRETLGIKENEMLVGYLGSYAFYHDTSRLVLATALLLKRGVKNIRVLMVGRGKEYQGTLNLIERLGLLNSIIMMKPGVSLDDVPSILSALDIAVLPGSTDIIAPIKISEYMAAELPAIVPDYTCNREVIDDGINGVLFEPKNEEDLADKIKILVSDMEMRKKIGREARQKVIDYFSWEKTWGAALEEVLRRITK